MKSILLCLSVVLSSTCFSMTPEVQKNMTKMKKLCTYHGPKVGIKFLTHMLERPETTAVDSLHYFYQRSLLNKSIGNEIEYWEDKKHVDLLISENEECLHEFKEYYEEK